MRPPAREHRQQSGLEAIDNLNAAFGGAGFTNRPLFQRGAQPVRASSGVEFQAVLPKIHAPVRLYWAYNVVACTASTALNGIAACNLLAPPFVLSDPSNYPNRATFQSAQQMFGPQIIRDPRSMLRLAIGFSF